MNNSTIENLSLLMCMLVDFPAERIDCSQTHNICVKCRIKGAYLSGESIDDIGSISHVICDVAWLLTLIVGALGICANFVIILILHRRHSKSQRNFDLMLSVLACFDNICCIGTIVMATIQVAIPNNWIQKENIEFHVTHLSYVVAAFGRSTSVFLTLLITTERYLRIRLPIRARIWFTPKLTKILILLVVCMCIALNILRATSEHVQDNPYGRNGADIRSIRDLKEIITLSDLSWRWRVQIAVIDYIVPLPLLLFINCLTYYEIWKFSQRRVELNLSRRKDVSSAKLFLPVIIVLLVSNIFPIGGFIVASHKEMGYRELFQLSHLSVAVTCSVNFPIYYMRGSAFREEAHIVLRKICGKESQSNMWTTRSMNATQSCE